MSVTLTPPATIPAALPVLPAQVDLAQLHPRTRHHFLQLMDLASGITDNLLYTHAHRTAADLIGIALPARSELAVCSCSCDCRIVHDAWQSATHLDGTVERVQCPDCTADHRRYGE